MKGFKRKLLKKLGNKILKGFRDFLVEYYGKDLISLFVTGSFVHEVYNSYPDIDVVIIVRKRENSIREVEQELSKIYSGNLQGYVPEESIRLSKFFKTIKNYRGIAVVHKFVIGKFFPKRIGEMTLNFHILGPMSIKVFELFGKLYPFHVLTMVNNSQLLYGVEPKVLVKVKPDKSDFLKWLSVSEKRIGVAKRMLIKDPKNALSLTVKEVLKIAMEALVMQGIYENENSKVVKIYARKFNHDLKFLPQKFLEIKRKSRQPSSRNISNLIDESFLFLKLHRNERI